MRFLGSLLQSSRPLIVLGIAMAFFAVHATHGPGGLWLVLKLVAIGIVLNFAIWLACRRIWQRAVLRNAPKQEEPH